jgi:hypothetical protein
VSGRDLIIPTREVRWWMELLFLHSDCTQIHYLVHLMPHNPKGCWERSLWKTLNAKPIKRFVGIVALPIIAHFRIILPNIWVMCN